MVPVWQGVQVIRDNVTLAKKAQIALTMHMLFNLAVKRTDRYHATTVQYRLNGGHSMNNAIEKRFIEFRRSGDELEGVVVRYGEQAYIPGIGAETFNPGALKPVHRPV